MIEMTLFNALFMLILLFGACFISFFFWSLMLFGSMDWFKIGKEGSYWGKLVIFALILTTATILSGMIYATVRIN